MGSEMCIRDRLTTPSSVTPRPLLQLPVDSLAVPPPMSGTPLPPFPMNGNPSPLSPVRGQLFPPSPMTPSRPSPSSTVPLVTPRSTSSRPPRVRRAFPPSTDSALSRVSDGVNSANKFSFSVNKFNDVKEDNVSISSAPIRPVHFISDYNRRDFTRSSIPGSVYNLHVKF